MARSRLPLRLYLFLGFALTAALPLLIFGVVLLAVLWRGERARSAERLGQAAQAVAGSLDAHVEEHRRALALLAIALESQRLLLGREAAERELGRQRGEYPAFLTLALLDAQGTFVAVSPSRGGEGSDLLPTGSGADEHPCARETLSSGEPCISEAFRGAGLGVEPIVALGVPLRSPAGQPQGALVASLDLMRLRRAAQLFATTETELLVLDSHRHVVYSSTRSQAPMDELATLSFEPTAEMPPGQAVVMDGQRFLAARAPVPAAGWTALARLPLPVVDRPAWKLLGLMGLTGGVTLGLALAVAGMASKRITRPIERLAARLSDSAQLAATTATDGLASGLSGPREVGALASGLTKLAARLRRSDEELHEVLAHVEQLAEERSAAVRQSEARLRSFLEEAHDLIQVVDPRGRLLFVNRAWRVALGYEGVDLDGLNLFELIAEESREHCSGLFEHLLSGQPVSSLEAVFRTRDGRRLLVSGSCMPQRQGDDVVAVRSILRDVTQERQAERALRESEERFREMADNLDAVFFLRDARTGQMLYISPAYERIWGRHAAALLEDPQALLEGVHPDDREDLRAALRVQAQGLSELEYRVLRPDGGLRFVQARAFPLRDEHGVVRRVAGIIEDVTARKQLEAWRDEVLQALVHDLRNPLTSLMGALSFLPTAGPALSERQQQLVGLARRGSDKLLTLVNNILDLTRLELGVLPLERRPLDVKALVSEALVLEEGLARERGLTLEGDLPDDLPGTSGDAAVLARVLQNLIDNALRFSPSGGHVRVAASSSDGHVRVSVSDDGPGLPEELRPHLFERFVTGHHAQSGSGLGLAFCRVAVQAHGGRIWAENVETGGARFVFELPVGP